MTKIRFHENVHETFKNLTLGYIMEWGSIDETIINEADICAIAVHRFPKYVDGIVIAGSNTNIASKVPLVRKKLGETNFMINIRKGYRELYPGYTDINNWRLRPGMCDSFFD